MSAEDWIGTGFMYATLGLLPVQWYVVWLMWKDNREAEASDRRRRGGLV